ncbi:MULTISPECIES: universal stress protein [Salinibaculum]|uniref:universal stress protein n=1 Tax=Salinibaculum TaxID=2732368 RepID=UPI0030CD8AED
MHILLGIGDADDGLRALERVVSRAQTAGDDLTVAVYGDGATPVDELVARVHDRLDDLDFDAAVEEVDGDPGGKIVELAEREAVDRIALPGGERSPLGKIRLDRVTEFVLLNASISVTLIR